MRVVVPEFLPSEALAILSEVGEVRFEPELHSRREALRGALADAEALVVRNDTRVDAELVAGNALRVVGRVGVGLDNLDLRALRSAGITVTWAPGANAASVAEYVIGAMLALARRFAETSAKVHAGSWDRRSAIGWELSGATLGIVGLGDIGARVARRAQALGMRLVANDPSLPAHSLAVQEFGAELLELPELLSRSDVVTLHVPLLPSTRHLIGPEALARMKPSAILVNTARGGLVDERALAAALREGRLGGAALDVRDPEPPAADDPLRGTPNLLLTPHIAGVTEASLRRAATHVARDVVRVLQGRPPVSPVPH